MKKLEELKKYFKWCLEGKYPRLKFTLDKTWLSVEYLNILNYQPSNNPENSYGYKILACQDLTDYDDIIELVNRINLRLACELSSKQQDLNGIQEEYDLRKKPLKELMK